MYASSTHLVPNDEFSSTNDLPLSVRGINLPQKPLWLDSQGNAPPSYGTWPKECLSEAPDGGSIASRIQRIKENTNGCCSCCLELTAMLFGSVIWTIVVIATLTVPVVMVIIGGLYIHACPLQPLIPIMLLVGGVVTVLNNIVNLATRFRECDDTDIPHTSSAIGWLTTAINLFSAMWFIAGCVWVYGIYKPPFDSTNDPLYCDRTVYYFSFWLLNSCFMFFALIFLMGFLGLFFTTVCN